MHDRNAKLGKHRRTLAVAMILSIAVHAAVFAFAKLRVPAMDPGDGDRAPVEAMAAAQEDRPLEVVRIRTEAPRVADRATVSEGAPVAERSLTGLDRKELAPKPAPSSRKLTLTEAKIRPEVATSALRARPTRAEASFEHRADYNEGVDFVAASAAAREARGRRDRDRDFGSGRGGSGILISGGGGAGCDHPVSGAAVNRFGPEF